MRTLTAILVTIFAMSVYGEDAFPRSSYDFVMLDIGLIPGSVDLYDIVMDISKSCDTDDNYLIGGAVPFDALVMASLERQLQKIDSRKITTKFGFPFSTDGDSFNEHMFIPKYADHGSETLFVLLPEVHPYGLPPQISEKNMVIEIKRSIFAIQWISDIISKGESVLNLKEGIEGLSAKLDWFHPSGDSYDDAFTLAGNNPYTTLFNIYSNSSNVYSTNVEESFYLFLDSMLFDGYKPGTSFDEVLSKMTPEGQTLDASAIPMIKEAYDKIQDWDQATLDRWSQNICEYRSEQMAVSALKHAKEKKSKLVFLTFGIAHTGGIVRALEKSKTSYMVLQATTKKLEP